MLSVDEALTRILAPIHPLPSETVHLDDALGRVLAEDVVARRSQPPLDVSAMDGYAVRFEDMQSIPATLELIGEVPAGGVFDGNVTAGQTVRIFTGAPVPNGADTVVMQEDTASAENSTVRFMAETTRGRHIRSAGIDFRDGDVGVPSGRRITARDLGFIAAMNVTELKVTRRPRVAILATGDELVRPGGEVSGAQIISSSPPALIAAIEEWGGEAVDLGIARDNEASIRETAAEGKDCDFFLTIGGASVGDYDIVQKVLAQDGLEVDFWKIAIKPGKPLIYGRMKDIPFMGLPGNPVSSYVCAFMFLQPALNILLNRSKDDLMPPLLEAQLGSAMAANTKRQDYARGVLEISEDGKLIATPCALQDSSVLSVLSKADCLIMRPPFAPAASVGDSVLVYQLS